MTDDDKCYHPQILIRLRQAVDHPYLVIYSATKREGMTPVMAPLRTALAPAAGDTSSAPETMSSSHAVRASARSTLSNGHATNIEAANGVKSASSASTSAHEPGDTSSDSEDESPRAGAFVGDGKGEARANGGGEESSEEGDEDDICGICSEPAELPVASACGHIFCRTW